MIPKDPDLLPDLLKVGAKEMPRSDGKSIHRRELRMRRVRAADSTEGQCDSAGKIS